MNLGPRKTFRITCVAVQEWERVKGSDVRKGTEKAVGWLESKVALTVRGRMCHQMKGVRT